MAQSAANDLVSYLKRRAGDHLRAAAYYGADDFTILYIKDQVESNYSEDQLEGIAERMRRDVRRHSAERAFQLGEFNCSLWAFERGIVIHFPQGSDRGTIITLEPGAASQFNDFIGDCAARMYD